MSLLFFAGHFIISILVEVMGIAASKAGLSMAEAFEGPSFGPSAGGATCLGALVFSLPRRTRQWLTMALAIGFGVKLAVFPEVSGDLTHLLGFGLGMLVMGQGIVRGRTQSTESSD